MTAALAEVTVEHFMDGRGEHARAGRSIRFKLANKIDALELLGKHHKLYIDRVEHEYGGTGLADRLLLRSLWGHWVAKGRRPRA
jgi:hypothetical protein